MEPENTAETMVEIGDRPVPIETSWKVIAQDLGRYVGYYLLSTALLSLVIYLS